MPGRDVRLDWWPSAEVSELQEFIDAEWRAGHILARDEELLRWQHPRSDDELSVVGATEDGTLVGIVGVIPVGLCLHGARLPGAWLTTWVVTPSARRQRVGLHLLDFVLERHGFVGTIGGNETTMKILSALRFHTRPAIPRWVRTLDAGALARLGVAPGLHGAGSDDTEPVAGPFSVRDWSSGDADRWDWYWRDRMAPEVVGVWRDAAYLTWRYLSHPRYRYRIRVAEGKDGAPKALLVHRLEPVRDMNVTVVRVVDALGDVDAVACLAYDLVRIGRERGAAFADFYCTSVRFAAGLGAAGFYPESALDVALPSRFQPLAPGSWPLTAALRLSAEDDSSTVFAGDDVYFTRSDCDQDRPN